MPREIPQYVSQLTLGSVPKVQYNNAQGVLTQHISEQLDRLGQDIYEKDLRIEKIRATTQLQVELNRQYQEFGSDPGKLRQAQMSYKSGFIKGIKNPQLAAEFEAGYDSVALPYLNKSTEIYADNQDKALKLAIMDGTNAEVMSAESIADGVISPIPEHQQDAGNALARGMTRIEQYKNARNHDGSMMFSPSEIMAEEKRIQAAYEKKAEALRVAPVKKGILDNPGQTALDIQAGKYDNVFKDQKEKDKWLKDSQERFESLEKSANVNRVIQGAVANSALYEKVHSGDVSAFEDIENYRANGGDPVFADTMRDSLLKIRPIPADEQDKMYSSIMDQVAAMEITTKDGEPKVGNKDITLQDAVRLHNEIAAASVRGVKGVDGYRRKVGQAIVALGKKEQGYDDKGIDSFFGFFRNEEEYDPGYEVIQKFLESQDKEKDYGKKAGMMRQFVTQAEKIPDEIKADKLLYKQAQEKIANFVVSGEQAKGMKNIPVTHIQKLKDDPSPAMRKYFDEAYGNGSAARVLGQ